MVDAAVFRLGIEELCATFGRDCSDALVSAWWRALGGDYSDAEWECAVATVVANGHAMPVPADFPRPKRSATIPRLTEEDPEKRRAAAQAGIAEAKRLIDQIETRAGKVLGFAHGSKRV